MKSGVIEHGAFTESFIAGLSGAAADASGAVTTASLYEHLTNVRKTLLDEGRSARLSHRGGAPFRLTGKPVQQNAPPTEQATSTDPPPTPDVPPTPAIDRNVPTQLDIASTVDQLNRRPFARILGRRIWEVNEKRKEKDTPEHEKNGAYIIHLHGPWGSGKSTVLNFLREEMRPKDDPTGWVVIDFNAWRTQSTRPPWWTLVREVHRQARMQVPFKYKRGIWWHWVAWRWTMAVGPWVIAAAVMVTVAFLLKGLGTAQELIAGVIAGAITLATLGRSLLFGSSKAADSFMDQRKDAARPVKERYTKLIRAIAQPVIVFVDDVDRCDKSYVVELLEGIQTLFRDAPVTFLIAADRKWICRSFEKHYEDFNQSVGEPTRPLGYLFLEKLFQLSVSLPPLSQGLQKEFMKALLLKAKDPAQAEKVLEAAEQAAERKLDAMPGKADVDRLIDSTTDVVEKQALQRADAKRLASVTHDPARQHELEPFAELLEPNPRAMKRLLNAYGMQQSLHRLEDRRVPAEHLARWTIIELRWPLFAEHAVAFPLTMDLVDAKPGVPDPTGTETEEVADELAKRKRVFDEMPAYIKDLLDDPHLVSVVGVSTGGGRILTPGVLLSIVGAVVSTDPGMNTKKSGVPPKAATASA
ncbi:MAG: P-loop NTPase fold protein [Flavobacteriales bacterium]